MTVDALVKLGKYQIRGTLGKGAMGVVYDGFDPVIERRVAIKTIAKESIDPREASELLSRFKREAQAAGRLNHPNIVSIYDYGEDDGLAFIAMEFITGKQLQQCLDSDRRFDLRHLVRIMCDVLDALDHAHRNGVVHRDIKPGNIMITDEGRVKVADFGVARIESSLVTQVGTRLGTPAYMSPEQYQGAAVTGRSDLFSAGVILYELLTGERPFNGEGSALIQQILLRDPTPPSQSNPDLPRALDAVAMKALAKCAEDRFATAREFVEAIREAAIEHPLRSDVDVPHDERGALPAIDEGSHLPPRSAPARSRTGTSSISGGSNGSEVLLEAELVYWKEISNSTEAVDFEVFVRVFPDSPFATLARRRMARIKADAESREDACERRQQQTVADTAVQCGDGEAFQALDRRHRPVEAPPAHDRVDAQREIDEEDMPMLVDVVVASACSNTQTAVPVHDETETAKGINVGKGRQRGIDWPLPLRRLDAQKPKFSARPRGKSDDALPIDLSPRAVEPSPRAAIDVSDVRTETGTRPVPATRQPVRAHRFDGESRKALAVAAVTVAVLIGTGFWYAHRPEIARDEAQAPDAQAAAQAQTADAHLVDDQRKQDEAARLVEEERQRYEAARLVEEQPRPDEVARLVEEQHERTETARIVHEQRREEEMRTAERNRQLSLAREREEAARDAAMQSYQRAITLLDQGRTSEAVRLLRQLAHGGHGVAAKTLGDLYMAGERVLFDRQEATLFYRIAERHGVPIDRSAFVGR